MVEDATQDSLVGSVKVVVTGPWGVGKTCLLSELSESPIKGTRRNITDEDTGETITVGIDYGNVTVDGDLQLLLFGVSNAVAYDEIFRMLDDDVLGAIILVDDTQPSSHSEAVDIVNYFDGRGDVPYIIVTNRPPKGRPGVAAKRVRHSLRLDDRVRVLSGEVCEADFAKSTLIELFETVRETIHLDPVPSS